MALQRLAGIWRDVADEIFVVASEELPLHPLTRLVVHVTAQGHMKAWPAALRWEMANGCIYAVKESRCSHVAMVGDGTRLEWLPLHAGERTCQWTRLAGPVGAPPKPAGPAMHPDAYAARAGTPER